MAEFIDSLSIVQLIFITYFMRICDVSLNTIKTISVVQGRIAMAVVLGLFEVLIWVTVVSQVITRLGDYPILGVAYAAGYATGNAVGIVIDRFMALGTSVVRFISQHQGYSVADALRSSGQPVTTFDGEGRDGHCLLMYAICPRKRVQQIIKTAQSVDPNIFYLVEAVSQVRTLRTAAAKQQNSWLIWGKKK